VAFITNNIHQAKMNLFKVILKSIGITSYWASIQMCPYLPCNIWLLNCYSSCS